jgi:hypothetical protein
MATKDKKVEAEFEDCKGWKKHRYYKSGGGNGCGGIYFFGFIGALVYFIGQATNFWAGVLGFFQAIFWPAYLVYEGLKHLIK